MGSLGGFEETPRSPITSGTGWLRHGNPPGDLRLAPRCGARTRAGGCCRQPAMRNGRCRLHGGRSTGPRTAAGRAACAAARTRHGLRGKAFIALRREGRRRARRMAALRDEGLARQAIENGVAPPVAWFRRVAAGRTFAELVAAEIRAAKRPRRKGQDPRTGYLPRGARPIVDDLATVAGFARRLVSDMRRLEERAARHRGPLPGAVPIRTVTVVRRTLRAGPDGSLAVVSETVSERCYPRRKAEGSDVRAGSPIAHAPSMPSARRRTANRVMRGVSGVGADLQVGPCRLQLPGVAAGNPRWYGHHGPT
jgi:hypothetical protein